MTEPGDNRAPGPGGRGRLRASHADRERVIEVLKDAFVQGRLNKGELDARVGQAFASRTYAELASLTADIPTASPERQPARAQNPAPRSHTARDVAIGLVIGLILAVVIVFGGLLKYGAFGVLAIPIVAVVPLVLIANAAEQRHSRRQLPPRPGQGAQVLEGQPRRRRRSGQADHDPAWPRTTAQTGPVRTCGLTAPVRGARSGRYRPPLRYSPARACPVDLGGLFLRGLCGPARPGISRPFLLPM